MSPLCFACGEKSAAKSRILSGLSGRLQKAPLSQLCRSKINLSPERLPYCINRYWPSLTSSTLPCSISVSIARLNLRRRTV